METDRSWSCGPLRPPQAHLSPRAPERWHRERLPPTGESPDPDLQSVWTGSPGEDLQPVVESLSAGSHMSAPGEQSLAHIPGGDFSAKVQSGSVRADLTPPSGSTAQSTSVSQQRVVQGTTHIQSVGTTQNRIHLTAAFHTWV